MAGAKQHGAALRHRIAALLHRRLEIGRRDLGARRDVAQVKADARHDAVRKRIFVDRRASLVEMARRVDVGAAMVGHRKIHRRQAVHVAAVGKRLFVGLPDAVNDRGMPRIGRGAVVELTAEVDDLHERSFPGIGRHRLFQTVPARLVRSLPPCGGELERGKPRTPPLQLPPSLTLPHKGGGNRKMTEGIERAWIASLALAMTASHHTGLMPALAMTSRHFGTSSSMRFRSASGPLAMTS